MEVAGGDDPTLARPSGKHAGHLRRSKHQAPSPCVCSHARWRLRLNGRRPAPRRLQGGAQDQGNGGSVGSREGYQHS